MKPWLMCAPLAALALMAHPSAATAQDHEAGAPLTPAEAAGAWTLESGGVDLCVVTLGAAKAGGGYAAKANQACGNALLGSPAAWQPTPDGMQLVDAGGKRLIAFNRWSNSLFVSHRSSGVDVQLKRGPSRAALAADAR